MRAMRLVVEHGGVLDAMAVIGAGMLGQQSLVERETATIRLVPDGVDADLEAPAVRLDHATIDLVLVGGHEALALGLVAEGSVHAARCRSRGSRRRRS